MWQNIKYFGIWFIIFLLALVGYSYRHDLSEIQTRVMAELFPGKGFQTGQDSVSFPVSSDGHFHIRAALNHIPITFLVDTGASHITLSPGDANKLGISWDTLRFDQIYQTANGKGLGALVRINDFRIAKIHLQGINVSVNKAAMRYSLLGMSFFNRLTRYEVHNDILTLYWK